MDKTLVFLGALLLYLAWGALVVLKMAEPAGFIAAIAAGLTFIGKHISQPQAPPTDVAPLLAMPAILGEARALGGDAPAAPAVAASSATPATPAAPAPADAAPTLQ